MGSLDWLLEAVRTSRVFKRNKVSLRHKVRACVMYMAGLSYRAMTERTGLIPASHVAVHYWVRSLRRLMRVVKRRERRVVAVDETKLKLGGRQLYVWAAIDVDSREVLALDASWQRSSLNAWLFLRKMLRRCKNKPLTLVDRGPWYPWALRELGLPWSHITFGMRNRVERWFRTLKERTGRFYNNFPSRKGITCVKTFLETFMYWYNHLRTHQSLGAPPSEVRLS